ncbi:DUF6056 family protein [Paenimyroides baculatum]|uniref:4-amino-4-deoxy-L-arabinose transferase n=1 Tax=Paenimyroides baculatum TaxID=2608000 RepID=A0A5M6CCP5_9FLAO|nr:DUF6056 family protein [Paenimyroides baculatum]KAA5532948.1 hypothetical protein F0460_12960 [Paenimyroides baculatum]
MNKILQCLINKKSSIVLLIILVIGPLFYLSFFVYPSADDFSYAVMHKGMSFFEKQKEVYFTWSSRYFATAALSLTALNFGSIHYYGFLSVASLLLFYFGLVYLLKRTIVAQCINNWFLGALLFCAYVLFLPAICENFYWFPSVMTYFVPSALVLFLIANTLESYNYNTLKHNITATLLIFIIGGSNELLIGGIFLWLCTLVCFYYYDHRKINHNYVWLLFITTLLLGVIFFAPGNGVRSNVINSTRSISSFEVLKLSFYRLFIHYIKYAIWVFLLFVFVNTYFKIKVNFHKKITVFKLFLVANVFLFICIFITIYNLKVIHPFRVENLFYFISFTFLYFLSILIISKLELIFNRKMIILLIVSLTALFIFPSITSEFKNNLQIVYTDIFKGKAKGYRKQFLDRDAYLKKYALSKSKLPCKVFKIKNRPETLLFNDIQKDPNHFINKSIALYYGIDVIVLEED